MARNATRMRVAAVIAVATVLAAACNPTTRYRTLSLFFDGVPRPIAPSAVSAHAAVASVLPTFEGRRLGYREHGPYGARLCTECHASTAANSYVLPKDQLCSKCHDLRIDEKYVHGPVQSEGCTACHDPHSSPYPYLLTGDPATFCFRCHDQQDVAAKAAHKDTSKTCTECHDPHQSNTLHLLRASRGEG